MLDKLFKLLLTTKFLGPARAKELRSDGGVKRELVHRIVSTRRSQLNGSRHDSRVSCDSFCAFIMAHLGCLAMTLLRFDSNKGIIEILNDKKY